MTAAQTAILLLLTLGAIVTTLGDFYTTMIALQHGFTEMNPLNRWLFKKIGQPLTAFIELAAVLFLTAILAAKFSVHAAYAYAIGLTAVETVMCVRNYRLLKAAKISLK